jgi:hypothetical protein
MKRCADLEKVMEYVAGEIKAFADSGAFPLSEIAVMYTMKRATGEGELTIPEMIAASLERRGILSKWLSEDYRAKRSHDITASSVLRAP